MGAAGGLRGLRGAGGSWGVGGLWRCLWWSRSRWGGGRGAVGVRPRGEVWGLRAFGDVGGSGWFWGSSAPRTLLVGNWGPRGTCRETEAGIVCGGNWSLPARWDPRDVTPCHPQRHLDSGGWERTPPMTPQCQHPLLASPPSPRWGCPKSGRGSHGWVSGGWGLTPPRWETAGGPRGSRGAHRVLGRDLIPPITQTCQHWSCGCWRCPGRETEAQGHLGDPFPCRV